MIEFTPCQGTKTESNYLIRFTIQQENSVFDEPTSDCGTIENMKVVAKNIKKVKEEDKLIFVIP